MVYLLSKIKYLSIYAGAETVWTCGDVKVRVGGMHPDRCWQVWNYRLPKGQHSVVQPHWACYWNLDAVKRSGAVHYYTRQSCQALISFFLLIWAKISQDIGLLDRFSQLFHQMVGTCVNVVDPDPFSDSSNWTLPWQPISSNVGEQTFIRHPSF